MRFSITFLALAALPGILARASPDRVDLAVRQVATNGTNCVQHGDHQHCDGDTHDEHDDHSPTTTIAGPSAVPSPTGTNCVQHGDHFHCDGDDHDDGHADDHAHSAAGSSTSVSHAGALPSPTGKNCVQHGDHYHCDEPTATASASSALSSSAQTAQDTRPSSGASSIGMPLLAAIVAGGLAVAF